MKFPGRTSNIQGQGRHQFALPYRSGGDKPYSLPLAPRSVDVTSPYVMGVLDIRWDNPADYPDNSIEDLEVLGVHVYRTFDSPTAPYIRISTVPISALSLRDQSREVSVVAEDVLPWLVPGNNPTAEWVVRLPHKPLVVPGTNGQTMATTSKDVVIEVDKGGSGNWVQVPAFKVKGEHGEVVLNSSRTYDPESNKFNDPVLPQIPSGGLRMSYTYMDGVISLDLNRKVYYKVTTVAEDRATGNLHETPLEEVDARSPNDIGKIDWVWSEGIRRNRYILDQGGEWVKLYVRKWNGIRCPHYEEEFGYCGYKKKAGPHAHCPICYGTNYVGGYEGPIDLLIAPPDTEKAVTLLDAGLHISYEFQSWTGPYPLLNDRDILVRQSNDRFIISRPNYIGSRGAIYQQSFTLSQLDASDPVYHLKVDPTLSTPAGWDAYRQGRVSPASPVQARKPGVKPEVLITARDVTFENIMY